MERERWGGVSCKENGYPQEQYTDECKHTKIPTTPTVHILSRAYRLQGEEGM